MNIIHEQAHLMLSESEFQSKGPCVRIVKLVCYRNCFNTDHHFMSYVLIPFTVLDRQEKFEQGERKVLVNPASKDP